MITIGEKIKRLRKKKNLSQENVYPSNQSLVSQIESGINKRPTESTLRIIAKNFDMSFEELIDGTNYSQKPRKSTLEKSPYVFSQTDISLNVNENGDIIVKHKSYLKFDENGNELKYCPTDGAPLLSCCGKCGYGFFSDSQLFCMSCGESMFIKHPALELESDFWNNLEVNQKLQKEIKEKTSWYFETVLLSESEFEVEWDVYHENLEEDPYSIFKGAGPYYEPADNPKPKELTFEEFKKGFRSKFKAVKYVWIRETLKSNYGRKLIIALKDYEITILNKDNKDDELSTESKELINN